jgi:CDP-diacylglycerol--serine O-phosphatidyltransferase
MRHEVPAGCAMLKLKDYFTLGNLLCGFAAVIALFHHKFDLACYLIYLAYVFDVMDGPVARLTKQFDKFGTFFDEVSDYITNSIVLAFIVYYAFAYKVGWHWLPSAIIGAFPFVFGTIRQARGMERDLSYPCYWLGLPRPVLAIFVLSLFNSSIFTFGVSPYQEIAHYASAVVVVVGSFFHVSQIPFVNHKKRRWMTMLRFGKHAFLTASPIVFLLGWLLLDRPGLVYDHIQFCMNIYIFLSWTQIPKADLQRIRRYIRTGELIKPLVHRDSEWRSHTIADYWLDRTGLEPEDAAEGERLPGATE